MRIAVATHTLARIGGVETYIEQSVGGLIDGGHDVRVFTEEPPARRGNGLRVPAWPSLEATETRADRCRSRLRRRCRDHARPRQSGNRAVPCGHAPFCVLCARLSRHLHLGREGLQLSGGAPVRANVRARVPPALLPEALRRHQSRDDGASSIASSRGTSRPCSSTIGCLRFRITSAMSTRAMACRRLASACCRRPCRRPVALRIRGSIRTISCTSAGWSC